MTIITNDYIKKQKCKTNTTICIHLKVRIIKDVDDKEFKVWYCSSEDDICAGCSRTMRRKM